MRESKKARTDRAAQVFALLDEEYPDAHCALEHRTPYELAAATILSAQCTDARVNMVTPVLFGRYPEAEGPGWRPNRGRRGDHPIHGLLQEQDQEPHRHGDGGDGEARR